MSGTPGTSHLISIAAIEFYAALFACLLAFGWPRLGNRWFHRAEKIFARVAQSKGLAAAGVGLSVIVLRVAMLPLYPVPLPFDPDDFSTLLAMDTFAHGRLTNPTPVMWTHFETIHISMLPTYQSMYFPGQALLLFAGKVFRKSVVRSVAGQRVYVRGTVLDAAGLVACKLGVARRRDCSVALGYLQLLDQYVPRHRIA